MRCCEWTSCRACCCTRFSSQFPCCRFPTFRENSLQRGVARVRRRRMRRRRVITASARRARPRQRDDATFTRNFARVLGLRAVTVKFARAAPACAPGLGGDLCNRSGNSRREEGPRRRATWPSPSRWPLTLAFRRAAWTAPSDEPVVPSNLANSIESLSHWLCSAMAARAEAARASRLKPNSAPPSRTCTWVFGNYIPGASTPGCWTAPRQPAPSMAAGSMQALPAPAAMAPKNSRWRRS